MCTDRHPTISKIVIVYLRFNILVNNAINIEKEIVIDHHYGASKESFL